MRTLGEFGRRLGRGSRLRLAGAAVVVLAFAAASAQGEVSQLGDVQIDVQGSISPARLPERELAPTTLELGAVIRTTDETHVPRMETITVESNSHGRVETKGLPTCSPQSLFSTLTAQAKQICGKALIGTGVASAEIAFPEQPMFDASGPMLIFNGVPKHGDPVLVVHVHANVPAPTTFVTTGIVEQGRGRGPHITFKIPTIVGGQGSLTGFNATLHKVIRANCPAPSGLSGAVFPFAKSTFRFADGKKIHSVLVRRCQVRR